MEVYTMEKPFDDVLRIDDEENLEDDDIDDDFDDDEDDDDGDGE